jgi:S-formylglutathione hydrolase FrmB
MFELHRLPVSSALLRGNPCGDPHERTLLVLTPPGTAAADPLPVVWVFPAHGGSQGGLLANDPWREGFAERAGRLLAAGTMAPVRLALPDLFTRFGGSQVIDSPATGPYERHLWEELKPLLERRFATTGHGVTGHSSGGYGALVQAMRHPEIVRACACHAGDMLFEYGYLGDFPKAATRLRAEGGPEKFLAAFQAAAKKQDGRWLTAMNVLAMAACYSPEPGAPLHLALPFDPETAELREDVWRRWLAHDPVRLLDHAPARAALASLKLLFLDAGNRDEWNLHWGARAFTKRLRSEGIAHTYEEFDDGHMGTSYRFDRSLPLLARALTGA